MNLTDTDIPVEHRVCLPCHIEHPELTFPECGCRPEECERRERER